MLTSSLCTYPKSRDNTVCGDLLEMHILGAYLRAPELETLGVWPSNLCFNKTSL